MKTLKKLDIAGARHQHNILDNVENNNGISDVEVLNISTPATKGVAERLGRHIICLIKDYGTISPALKSRLIEGLEIKEVKKLTSYEKTFAGVMDNSSRGVELFFFQEDGSIIDAPFEWQEHSYGHGGFTEEDNSVEFEKFIAENISDNKYIISVEWDKSSHYNRNEYQVKRVVLN